MGVSAFTIVVRLNVIEQTGPDHLPGSVDTFFDAFAFSGGRKRKSATVLSQHYLVWSYWSHDFGVRLKQDSIEQHLQNIRHQRELFVMSNPADVKLISLLIEKSEYKDD